MISRPPPTIERPHSVNSSRGCSDRYTAMYCIVQFLNQVLRGQSWQSILLYNITNMHAMSYRSDFFACSCRSNNLEVAGCFTVSSVTPVFRVGSTSVLILTAMSDSKSLNTSLLEVMISSKNERVFIVWFEQPYIANHCWCVVGFNEWRLEAAYCLEWF